MKRWPLLSILAGLASLVLLGGLGVFGYAGTFSRYWADDYCYSGIIRAYGWLEGTYQWWRVDGNRFSTLTPVALSDALGQKAISALPAGIILFWVIAWAFFLRQVSQAFKIRLNWYWVAFLALFFTFFAVLLAPDRLQSLYWRMGTLHYTLPLPILLFILGLIAWGSRQLQAYPTAIHFICGLLAFFAAGLSETYAALQVGFFAIFLVGIIVFQRGRLRTSLVWSGSAALLGTLLAAGVMLLSPSNAWRSAALPPPDNLLLIIPYSLRYSLEFIFYSLRGQPLPYFVFLAGSAGAGLAIFSAEATLVKPGKALLWAFISLLVAYLLIVCSFAPSAYAGLQYPAGRAQMPGEFILLAGLSCAVIFAVVGIRSVLPTSLRPVFQVAALILVLAAGIYPLRAISVARLDAARLQTWAARWDARDADIRRQVNTGEEHIQTQETEVVQTLQDYGPEAGFWINGCAALFYGAQSLVANP